MFNLQARVAELGIPFDSPYLQIVIAPQLKTHALKSEAEQ